MIGSVGVSFFDDDLTGDGNLMVAALPFLFFFAVFCVAATWWAAADTRFRDTQTSLLISRSPPRY